MRGVERLLAQDLMFLCEDRLGWPQDIGAIGVFESRDLLDANGQIRIDRLRRAIDDRLGSVPRFRQLIIEPPFGLGWPYWTDALGFRIADHVRVGYVESPGDEDALLRACEELYRRPLERSRPLWEMWFLQGLAGGRVGFFMKAHHSIADGVAGVAVLAAFVDAVPAPLSAHATAWKPQRPPSILELLADNLTRRAAGIGRFLRALARPLAALRSLRRNLPAVREAFLEERAPATSFNREIRGTKRFDIVRCDLASAKRAAQTRGAKVNDVLLAAIAGGYRSLLSARGESVGKPLRALVPVSLHGPGASDRRGNVDGAMAVLLPVWEPDADRRLRAIAAETVERKKKTRPEFGKVFPSMWAQMALGRMLAKQRFFNAYVANVPGPPELITIAGARLLELYPIVPIVGNMAIGAGALSYAGQFNIVVTSDSALVPDVKTFVDGTWSAWGSLVSGSTQEKFIA